MLNWEVKGRRKPNVTPIFKDFFKESILETLRKKKENLGKETN